MTIESITQFINTVGFPVACCGGMGFFIKYITDNYRADIKAMTTAINNNTLLLQKLVDKLDGEE